jgi:c-di-GMP-binding flagellar brake protein YcgR
MKDVGKIKTKLLNKNKKQRLPDDNSYADKRQSKRITASVPARIELIDAQQEQEPIDLLTTDLSAGGVFFHSVNPLSKGAKVKIEIVLPVHKMNISGGTGPYLIKAKGSVLRSQKDGMAIIFDEDYQIYRYKKAKK